MAALELSDGQYMNWKDDVVLEFITIIQYIIDALRWNIVLRHQTLEETLKKNVSITIWLDCNLLKYLIWREIVINSHLIIF